MSQTSGWWNGGTTVDLSGPFPFYPTVPAVSFGPNPSPRVAFISPTLVRAVIPPGVPGSLVPVEAIGSGLRARSQTPFLYLPHLTSPAVSHIGQNLVLDFDIEPGMTLVAFAGLPPFVRIPVPPLGGMLAITPPFVLLFTVQLPFQSFTLSAPIPPDPMFSGLQLVFQGLCGPNLPALDGAFSNPVQVTLQ
jgi:hypothetical protein